MGRLRPRKPSPAMVVAIVALIFAVAGTSVAGVATISVLGKKEKQQTRKIARGEINKAAPGLSVANAVRAQRADSADALGGPAGAKLPVQINEEWNTDGAPQADQPLGTFGSLTVTGRCTDEGVGDPELRILVRNNGPAASGRAQIAYIETGGDTADSTSQSVGPSNLTLLVEDAFSASEAEGAGLLVYNDSAQVTVIDLRLFVESLGSDAFCEIAGQATTTTQP